MEAQITWDLGKMLGLQASNEKAVIDALSKVHEIQDFVLPRKRGRLRKKTNVSKKLTLVFVGGFCLWLLRWF